MCSQRYNKRDCPFRHLTFKVGGVTKETDPIEDSNSVGHSSLNACEDSDFISYVTQVVSSNT